ncbi:TRAP-type C4-dicarboxylate transport system permease small subunit [Cupriavidus metallidurans]|jgi:TRAP-type C4-dicarboxylate transport system permease small subunit|uniref:TRAP transporter small permease protein n=1 Tax=Cupriavidus metallidurans (strain ATCC 43123 / DSM 2839 / NBRC 102507 / CH34) TaxID=266264 RepID=Q1LP92_CUPMC|nr:TRAP transporter small permease [Cupriavidus metallidurans]ABF08034.1 Tripartite ATP-independent periplasmic transporter, DctQ component [Cupriavidus metallidurans CH34]AVA33309.1 TRAP transporter small permease [Cupriavidus metallidurans]MDE4917544.1 TRAP transporter small permease [Cupriavidus metallidurans]QGS27688.1 TRAP transporter small permease subunit [Cupriavidus metallidurans]
MEQDNQARRDAVPQHVVDSVIIPEAADEARDSEFRVSPRIEDWIGVIVMGLLVIITFANVVVRYFTDESFAWTEEFSVFLMIVLALVAGSAAVARDRNIRIEFFFERGSAARQKRLAIVSALAVAVMFLALAVLGVRITWDEYTFGETSPGIGVPSWWYSVWLPVLSISITLRALALALRNVRALRALKNDGERAQ